MRNRGLLPRTACAALLAVTLPVLVAGCSSGTGVQREAPGEVQSTARTDATGASLSMRARNVDLSITAATVRVDSSGTARLEFTVRNAAPEAEHLSTVTVPGGGQATLQGGGSATLSTAGVLLAAGGSTTFGSTSPSIVLPPAKGLTVGSTLPVSLFFGVAGLVRLDVPVKAA
ncbi:hypothetical protein [Streptacidiphilus sp. EB129]|uniref:hypothetical protein n=1 Tax=Streptacidiphilus sp. EB129 TaxID=3156262 RepID=UPI0035112FE7